MTYSFEMCFMFGDIFLSDDKKGCALIILPEKKRTTLRTIIEDLKLILTCVGIGNVKKALIRENKIRELHTMESMYYLWFIGVSPDAQHEGTGSKLLEEVIQHAKSINRPVYLETSTVQNIGWYQKFGFKIYNELDLGYKLYLLKNK